MTAWVFRAEYANGKRAWVAFDRRAREIVRSAGTRSNALKELGQRLGKDVDRVMDYKGILSQVEADMTLSNHRLGLVPE